MPWFVPDFRLTWLTTSLYSEIPDAESFSAYGLYGISPVWWLTLIQPFTCALIILRGKFERITYQLLVKWALKWFVGTKILCLVLNLQKCLGNLRPLTWLFKIFPSLCSCPLWKNILKSSLSKYWNLVLSETAMTPLKSVTVTSLCLIN